MFRKAAVALALAASFLGAHANKDTPPGNTARAKDKSTDLCLGGADSDWDTVIFPVVIDPQNPPLPRSGLFTGNFGVYNCAEVDDEEPEAIGLVGVSCPFLSTAPGLTTCVAELTLFTAWHKTNDLSSLAISFWTDPAALVSNGGQLDPYEFTVTAPVVTGATGAWGKPESISDITVEPREAEEDNYPILLTITYKGRGWDPTYTK